MNARGQIAVVVSGFPRLSETFALQELISLEAAGLLAAVIATKQGDAGAEQPGHERLASRVLFAPATGAGAQARWAAERLAPLRVRAVHGYFAHTPAEVAACTAAYLGIPYGFSAHARDVRKISPGELAQRAAAARCVVACNEDVAADLERAGARATLVRHGVDLARFRPAPDPGDRDRLELVAVGRLVPKKGFDVLLRALALVRVPVRLRLVGDGPERRWLEDIVRDAEIGRRVELVGALSHRELPAVLATAHAVVVPSVVDSTGDRDGLPNVVLEAMASARPVVASDVGAIPSAVADWRTGLLVRPGDAEMLASAIELLALAPELRTRLGRSGRRRVEQEFSLETCTARLTRCLETAYA